MIKDYEINQQKIINALNDSIKLHIVFKNRSWRNGYVVKVEESYFEFKDDKEGIEPYFFLEVLEVHIYKEGGR